MPNHLAHETSPYLLQHAHNPVDWYPWGEEALSRAQAEGKPIFLSIGYSACHWCHVMAHESFEDERVAAFLNAHFISIKVDREERPDLDQLYMAAVQAMTGQGGWPMSVFLTPDGRPFYGGTYFPPASRHGLPSFIAVLQAVHDAWQNRRAEIESSSAQVLGFLRKTTEAGRAEQPLQAQTLSDAAQALNANYDRVHGGWGGAPKFPQPMVLEFLLREHLRTRSAEPLALVMQTLTAMARGGLYDQLGGGFHRYAVDDHWLVPHFEKMLYDNAQLARVYLHAWQVTDNPFFRQIAEETLDYVLRELTDPSGGFYATQDADSEGEEGKYYLWTPAEIRSLLGEQADAFMTAYGVTTRGNFEGKNILTLVGSWEERAALAGARQQLLEARAQRVPPGCDDKVLTAWNGLMLAALAEAARALGRADYRQAAERNADFLLTALRDEHGRLRRSWKAGQAKLNGYLEDYTHLAEGLLALYQATFAPRWYWAAQELLETILAHFVAPTGFYDTSDDHETLIARPRDLQDNAVPSGNAMAVRVLLQLAELAVEPRYVEQAEASLRAVQPMLAQYPLAFGQWLIALDDALSIHHAVAVVGPPEAEETRALLAVLDGAYRPHQTLAVGGPEPGERPVPLLAHRPLPDGRAAAYVCVNFTCRPPVNDPAALRDLLEATLSE